MYVYEDCVETEPFFFLSLRNAIENRLYVVNALLVSTDR